MRRAARRARARRQLAQPSPCPPPPPTRRRRRPPPRPARAAGSAFWLGISTFGVLFLGLLAQLIKRGYPYAGEWFEAGEAGEPAPPLEEQRAAAVAGLMSAVGIYLGVALLSGAMVCYHRVRRR